MLCSTKFVLLFHGGEVLYGREHNLVTSARAFLVTGTKHDDIA